MPLLLLCASVITTTANDARFMANFYGWHAARGARRGSVAIAVRPAELAGLAGFVRGNRADDHMLSKRLIL
jgi:hypothetical protein